MALGLKLVGLTKKYKRLLAVDNLDLEVKAGEFCTLLGPSGCGKTTTLRLIAGLERGDGGEIYLGDRLISSGDRGLFVEPEARSMGMVFQSYAVWPHMTVAGNVEFPLKLRGVPAEERRKRVREVLRLVGLEGYEDRGATQLSGGQQQRVALARGLVYRPEVLLLDEPLSNLDAKLREQMRVDLRILQKQLGMTTIFVTHDQVEAMVLSDRVVVMNQGKVEQEGTPEDLYQRPATRFVMDFLGRVNYLPGRVVSRRGEVAVLVCESDESIKIDYPFGDGLSVGQQVTLCIRPEDVTLVEAGQERSGDWAGVVEVATFLGHSIEYIVRVGETPFRAEGQPSRRLREGAKAYLRVASEALRIWPRSEEAVSLSMPQQAPAMSGSGH